MDALGLGVLHVDRRLVIVGSNASASRILGVRRSSAAGARFASVVRPAQEQTAPWIEATLVEFARREERSPLPLGLISVRLPSNEIRPVNLILVPPGHPSGPRCAGAVATVVVADGTTPAGSFAAQQTALSMVGHELRTPLLHIKGYATTLLQPDVEWDEATKNDFIRTIDREADRMAKLVERMTNISRIVSGQEPVAATPQEPEDLIRSGVEEASVHLGSHRVRICGSRGLPAVYADADQIVRVFVNLLDNAAKYSPADSEIVVSAEIGNRLVLFLVSDRGPGIPADMHEQIFELFKRTPASRMSSVAGTGLGLWESRTIIEAHRGELWVESAPGAGATFCFWLPRAFDRTSEMAANGLRSSAA